METEFFNRPYFKGDIILGYKENFVYEQSTNYNFCHLCKFQKNLTENSENSNTLPEDCIFVTFALILSSANSITILR